MDDNQARISQLLSRLEVLVARQEHFSKEINALRNEIYQLGANVDNQIEKKESTTAEQTETLPKIESETQQKPVANQFTEVITEKKRQWHVSIELEKFIGENLINKIGIAITIIGVGIGVKYSIDHELITPLMRVISGYVIGVLLLIVGIKLKSNYLNYSAVLVSGAIAIMYFITFAAYSFYDLMPSSVAFAVMVIFTVLTILTAISYNQEIISLIGLVGAYAVPFLLGSESGSVKILLSYISIINIGILIIAVLRYWKILYYSSFILSWTIFCFWYVNDFQLEEHFALTLIFLVIFFLTFYATFLSNKLISKEKFNIGDVIFILINSFIFYGLGYITLEEHVVGEQNLGLFTIGNALIHFIISVLVLRQSQSDKNLFFLLVGTALVFITVAVPVQLDGNWVTLLWIGEATLLFWIGRTRATSVYEKLSYSLLLLAFMSLLQDWSEVYNRYITNDVEGMMTPVLNVQFLSSLIFVACFGFILYLSNNNTHKAPDIPKFLEEVVKISILAITLISIYFAIHLEIANYWNQLYVQSAIEVSKGELAEIKIINNQGLLLFKSIWLSIYSLVFFGIFSMLNTFKIKELRLGNLIIILSGIALYIFFLGGLYFLSDLRESYLNPPQAEYFEVGIYYLIIRYIALTAAVLLILVNLLYIKKHDPANEDLNMVFAIATHISILWMLSSELIHWLDISESSGLYKLGLSILWGAYSLFMIALGIWKKKKHLRIMAIIILAVTLIKLLFYDVAHLDTIPKTILFVSLGILLLIISFLYNKYKYIISDEG